jgi:hypothetical protein
MLFADRVLKTQVATVDEVNSLAASLKSFKAVLFFITVHSMNGNIDISTDS